MPGGATRDSFGFILLFGFFKAVSRVSCCHSSCKGLVMLFAELIFLVI